MIRIGDATRPKADVVMYSTESRELDATAAADTVRKIVLTSLRDERGRVPRWVYKKQKTQRLMDDSAVYQTAGTKSRAKASALQTDLDAYHV